MSESVPALIGRTAEVGAIVELLGAVSHGPAALIIEGEPGIGKTTLWLDALQRARELGLRVLTARASAAESVLAYAALTDLLTPVDQGLWADLPAPQRNGLAAALLSEYETAAGATDPRAVGVGFLTVLNRLSAESPVVVAVDDLQWLDSSSASALAFAARRMSGRVAWLCTARSDAAASSTNWLQLPQPDAVRRLRLPALTLSELHDVLIAQLGRAVPRPRLLRIHENSGGNPFYAKELARELDQMVGVNPSLPDSLAELTRARISRLRDGAEDALLAIASLAAPSVSVVAHALALEPQHLLNLLEEAETRDILTVEGNHLRFTHPMLAHAVRLGATAPRRRTMHRRLAEVVTEPELRARHLALADPVGRPETLDALDTGAEIARKRGAPAAAAELLELAINLGGASAHRRILLAQCLFDSGDLRLARHALQAAIDDLPPGAERAEAMQRMAMVRLYDDGFLEAAELCEQALADCTELSALRVIIMTTLSFAHLNMGRPDVALTTATHAVADAERLKCAEPLGRALGMRAMMQFMNGDGVDSRDLHRATALERPDAHVPLALRPSVQSALVFGWTGDMAAARDTLSTIGQRCEAVGEEGEMMFVAFQLVLMDTWLADLSGAADVADAALVRARQLGGDAASFLASSMMATVATYQGRIDEARRHAAVALAAGGGSGYVLMMSWTVAMQGFLELSLGDHAKALATLAPLIPMVSSAPRYTEIIGASFVPDAAEALIGLGRLEEAEPLVHALEDNGARLDRPWMLAVGSRCRGLMLAARGDVTGGVVQVREALTHHDRISMPFERARTLLVLGRLERRLRHWRSANAALTEALTSFERIGTPLWVAQVRAELARGTAGRTRTPGLTPTERRVAELAAGGMNNQDIAASLFIARKTVEVNLSRIYHKLGIHSRIELFQLSHSVGLGAAAVDDVALKAELDDA